MDKDLCLVLISPAFISDTYTNAKFKNTLKEPRIALFKGLNLKCPLSTCQAKVCVT